MDSQQLLRSTWREQQHDTLEAILPYRVWVDLIRSITVGALAWSCSSHAFAADAGQLASVQVNEPGEWRPFAVGQLVASQATGNGEATYWRTLPEPFRGIASEHYYLVSDPTKSSKIEYGKLDFAVVSDGAVWMLTTARFFDSGNADGNWRPEVKTQAQLETDGWRVIARDAQSEYGSAPPGENKSLQDWVLFERTCKAGERFSIRTEKYQSPVILRAKSGITENARGLRLRLVKSGTGRLQLEAKGEPGLYVLQSASDLRSWVDVKEARLTSTDFEMLSSVDTTVLMRFFRLQKSPSQPPQPPAAAPVIITHPVSFSVKEGQRFGLSVVATGSGPLTFQWFLNGTPIPGATASLYSATAKLDSAGSYTVTVSSGLATVTSRQGVLTVIPNSPEVAPVSLIGRTIRVSSSQAGPYRFITSPNDAKYVVFPDNGFDGTKGTFTFTKSGPDQAAIILTDYWYGRNMGLATFTSASAGSLSLGDFSGPFTIEESTASNASLAPTALAGKSISAAIIDGDGFIFSDAGGYSVAVQSNGTGYSVTGFGALQITSGAVTYRRLTATTSSIAATDSRLGLVTGALTWYSATRGELSLSRSDGAWQNCVFQLQ